MRIVTGCLRSTVTVYIPILACIQPAELHRGETTLFLAYRSRMDPKHLLNQVMVGPTTASKKRLLSRHFFAHAARNLLNKLSQLSIRAAQCGCKWA